MRLASVFSDHAVLQAQQNISIWGDCLAAAEIEVTLAGRSAHTTAGSDGRWCLELPPLSPGGPFELVATCQAQGTEVRVQDVLVGELWLASGQSNMDMVVEKASDAQAEIAAADFPLLRIFTVAQALGRGISADVQGRWKVCSPREAAGFSAVAYHFGRKVTGSLGVPVGVVVSAWGGTVAQAWTSGEGLASEAGAAADSAELQRFLAQVPERAEAEYRQARERFLAALPQDAGNLGVKQGWADPHFEDSRWKLMDLPRIWFDAGYETNGVFWFRRAVDVPAAWVGRDLELSLGPLDKNDDTYAGGLRVGGITWAENPDSWKTPRVYLVPGSAVTSARLLIALRIMSQYTGGGTSGPARAMFVRPADDQEGAAISLAGPWRVAIEQDFGRVRGPGEPAPPAGPNVPSMLFNTMIAPLARLKLRGFLWYQGESNDGDTARYYRLFPLLIRDWRRVFGQGDLPFLFVQLANYQRGRPQRVADDSRWAEIREAQSLARQLPATAMAVAIDVGDSTDIHPKNKKAVGERLALAALATVYGRQVAYLGPRWDTWTGHRQGAVVTFTEALGLRFCGAASGFAVAGADQVFYPARARTVGQTVQLSCAEVAQPAAVRYGWEDDPTCTLENAAGLPAEPFRTDRWPLGWARNQVV